MLRCLTAIFGFFLIGFSTFAGDLSPIVEDSDLLTEKYELRTAWIWQKEIQLQIQNKDRGFVINLVRAPKNTLKVDILVYSENESQFELSLEEFKLIALEAILNSTNPHLKFFGDKDDFWGLETNFRKRLIENELPESQKFLGRLKKLIGESVLEQTSFCQELLSL